jgi:hypothetical protein
MRRWPQSTALDVPAEGGGAAALDGRHDLELSEAEVTGISRPKGGPCGGEDVGDLERRAHRGQPPGLAPE